MTDTIAIDESGHVALPQRPEEPSLPPGQWIKKNLFSRVADFRKVATE